MFNLDKTDMQRFAVSAIGALTLTAASVFAAVGPAKAAAPTSLAAWQDQVAHRIAGMPMEDARFVPSTPRVAELALHFDGDGGLANARLVRSSGDRAIDGRALRVAGRLAYPAFPAGFAGRAQDVMLRLHFGDASSGATVPAAARHIEVADTAKHRGTEIAAR